MKAAPDFYKLHIDQVFQCAELCGFRPTGEYFQLNSYENRVFDLFLEPDNDSLDKKHVIVKVYRPFRWSLKAIEEEHHFLEELAKAEMTAVVPYIVNKKSSIKEFNKMFFSFFPKASGRMPQELSLDDYSAIGRQLARLHNIGQKKPASHRPSFSTELYGHEPLRILQEWVAPEVWERYLRAGQEIVDFVEDRIDDHNFMRIHGDCHKGNILQTDPREGAKQYFFVDFDDFINGLPVQDFWMLLSGSVKENRDELDALLTGYEELRLFDDSQLELIPALRGLRIIHYASWIARRWNDPTFPKLFPEFRNYIYWAEEVEALEKIAWSL